VSSYEPVSLLIIVAAAVLGPTLADLIRRPRVPGVVMEIALGILVGPQVLGWASRDVVVDTFASVGLCFLLFLAGYEIDLRRIRGTPMRLAGVTWALSLALALVLAGALAAQGFVIDGYLVGLALTTTALGTLLPIVADAGLSGTKFGSLLLAVGTVGEFGPLLAVTLFFSGRETALAAAVLAGFAALTIGTAAIAMRVRPPRFMELLRRTLHSSSQLPVRLSVLLLVGLITAAGELGLDTLLGAFAAGLIVRMASSGPEAETVRIKLDAIGYGFVIPIFFVVTGIGFDLDALTSSPGAFAKLPLILLLFLLVRGVPTLLVYRRELPPRARTSLALMSSTALPMVVVITNIGLDAGEMRSGTAAALVGAAMLSVFVFPAAALVGLTREEAEAEDALAGTGPFPEAASGVAER
jgi:Kef-type K+ transport system membrane component KefB